MRNFGVLSDYDFQLLVRHLLRAEWGIDLVSGPDGARYLQAPDAGGTVLVFCHHQRGNPSGDLAGVIGRELPRWPASHARCIVATTAEPSPDEKVELSRLINSTA